VTLPVAAAEVVSGLARAGFLAGVSAGRWWPELENVLLVAVTERRTREQMDDFVGALGEMLAGRPSASASAGGPGEVRRG
jgi:glycine dehydrogenase subunit 1